MLNTPNPGPAILVVGDSKAGKSINTIAGLCNFGYEVFVNDFDKGAQYVLPFLSDEGRKRFHYCPLTEKIKWRTAELKVFSPITESYTKVKMKVPDISGKSAWSKFLEMMNDWTDPFTGEPFGSPFDWGPERVLFNDSGTEMGEAAMRDYLNTIGRGGTTPRISDWGAPQALEVAVHSDLVGASCGYVTTYHLKHIRPPSLIDDNADAVIEAAEAKAKKKGGEVIDTTFTRQLWPTGLGEKNARYGVLKLFSIYVRIVRDGEGSKMQLKGDDDVDLAIPLPTEKKKELEKLPAIEAFPRLMNMFAPLGG